MDTITVALMRAGRAVAGRMDIPDKEIPNDLELVRRSREGDTEAFSELVRRHERMIYNLALRFLRDPVLAEDMAQEAFLKAFRLLGGFRGDAAFSTWLYRVTTSVCLNEIKRRGKRQEEPLETGPAEHAQTTDFEARDRAELVRRCVTMLPDRYATIMTLYYLDGVAYEDIAAVMDIPLGTLKTWMFRARKELKELVEKEIGRDAL